MHAAETVVASEHDGSLYLLDKYNYLWRAFMTEKSSNPVDSDLDYQLADKPLAYLGKKNMLNCACANQQT
jgi:hypothetical protein